MINLPQNKTSNLEHLFAFYYPILAIAFFCFADLYSAIIYRTSIYALEFNFLKKDLPIILISFWVICNLMLRTMKDFAIDSLLMNTMIKKFSNTKNLVSFDEIKNLAFQHNSKLIYDEYMIRQSDFRKIENSRIAILVIMIYCFSTFFYYKNTTFGEFITNKEVGISILFFTIFCCYEIYIRTGCSHLVEKAEIKTLTPLNKNL